MLVKPFLKVHVLTCVLALVLAGGSPAQAASKDDLVAAGKQLYLKGLGVSGEPIRAIVQGDVPLSGTQVTCQSCHGRSGMGTIESGRIPPAIAGPFLFTPDIRTRTQRQRPAYTDETLARAVRDGIDAAGKPLDPLMPRFQLGERDLTALTAYLRQLGATLSPGSDANSLRVATVIAGDVDPVVERAELDVIKTYIDARNRGGPQRLRGGHFPHDEKEIYREWSYDIWRVSGPPETWRSQIEKLYRKQPVFALIGGLSSGSWQPVYDFCKAQELPCLLPDIDLPPDDVSDFYSFYFSRGVLLEADIMASVIKSKNLGANVLSIVDSSDVRTVAAATELEQTLKKSGAQVRTLDIRTSPDTTLAKFAANNTSAIVLWLNTDDLQQVGKGSQSEGPPLFLSATLLSANREGTNVDKVPATLRSRAQVVQLTALPNDPDPALRRYLAWARVQKVKVQEERRQALAYFACMVFAEGVKHTGLYLSRDYVLDLLNHSSKLTAYLPLYTRGGITPWQRVLSRGGYLVDLSGRSKPTWVVP
jgi:ABC-type branched-subunit amino acid transport system substrate-binding protein/mono/diheme cytochrome c family protein